MLALYCGIWQFIVAQGCMLHEQLSLVGENESNNNKKENARYVYNKLFKIEINIQNMLKNIL